MGAQEFINFGGRIEDTADPGVPQFSQGVDIIARTGYGLNHTVLEEYCNAPHKVRLTTINKVSEAFRIPTVCD